LPWWPTARVREHDLALKYGPEGTGSLGLWASPRRRCAGRRDRRENRGDARIAGRAADPRRKRAGTNNRCDLSSDGRSRANPIRGAGSLPWWAKRASRASQLRRSGAHRPWRLFLRPLAPWTSRSPSSSTELSRSSQESPRAPLAPESRVSRASIAGRFSQAALGAMFEPQAPRRRDRIAWILAPAS
jgi:hypothetical protein